MTQPARDPRAVAIGRALVGALWVGLAVGGLWLAGQIRAAAASWEAAGGWVRTLRGNEEDIIEPHPHLGWVHRPNSVASYGEGGRVDWSIDGNRFRGHDNAPRARPPGRRRIAAIGDSFTFGNVPVADNWTERLETHLADTDVLNMGVSGYGVGQMLLWYEQFCADFEVDLVIVSIIEDDLIRAKRDRFATGFAVPRFSLVDGALVHDPTPLPPRLDPGARTQPWLAFARYAATWVVRGRADHPAQDDGEYTVPFAILDALATRVRADGREVLLVVMPTSWSRPAADYGLTAFAQDHDIPLLDLYPPLRQAAPTEAAWDALFLPDNHPSVDGNAEIGRLIAARLIADGWPAAAR